MLQPQRFISSLELFVKTNPSAFAAPIKYKPYLAILGDLTAIFEGSEGGGEVSAARK
jgi:hypothetical protein